MIDVVHARARVRVLDPIRECMIMHSTAFSGIIGNSNSMRGVMNHSTPGNNRRESDGPSLSAASDCLIRCLSVTDHNTRINFLIDAGTNLCVYSRKLVRNS